MTVQSTRGWLQTRDGLQLFFRAWVPARPRAVMLLVHGLAEHSGRYEHVGSRYAARGFAVYALDYRCHGRSPGPRVHVRDFSLFVDDVDLARTDAAVRHPGLPTVLVGHSQGGLVALLSATRSAQGLQGLVMSSPFLGVHEDRRPSFPLAAAARILAAAGAPLRIPSGATPEMVSRDPAVVSAYRDDPLVSRKVSAPWFAALVAATEQAKAAAPSHRLHTLLMYAGADRLVSPEASAAWSAATPPGVVETVRWDGLYHEIFNEPEKEQVFSRMDQWLETRVPSPA